MLVGLILFILTLSRYLLIEDQRNLAYLLIACSITAFTVLFSIHLLSDRANKQLVAQMEHFAKHIREEIHGVRSLVSISSAGIEYAFRTEGEALKQIPLIIARASSSIDILRITFPSLLWDLDLQGSIENALQRGLKMRVLLLNPQSTLIPFYARQEKRENFTLVAELHRSIDRWEGLRVKYRNFELRLHDFIFTASMVVADDLMIVGPYLYTNNAMGSPQLQARSGPLFHSYMNHFESCWQLAAPATVDSE